MFVISLEHFILDNKLYHDIDRYAMRFPSGAYLVKTTIYKHSLEPNVMYVYTTKRLCNINNKKIKIGLGTTWYRL